MEFVGTTILYNNVEYAVLHKTEFKRAHLVSTQYLLMQNGKMCIGAIEYGRLAWVHDVAYEANRPELNYRNRDEKTQQLVRRYALNRKRGHKIAVILHDEII